MVPQLGACIRQKLQRKDEHGWRKWDSREMRMVDGMNHQLGMKLQVAADHRSEVDVLEKRDLSEDGRETFDGVGRSRANCCRAADPLEV